MSVDLCDDEWGKEDQLTLSQCSAAEISQGPGGHRQETGHLGVVGPLPSINSIVVWTVVPSAFCAFQQCGQRALEPDYASP